MPQWRKLWTKTTESLDLNDMPDDFHRLLWLMLPLIVCREGRGIDNPAWIKAKAMPLRMDVRPEQVEAAMAWYAGRGMLKRYEVDGRPFFALGNWHKYQGNTEREAGSDYPGPDEGQVATNSRPTQDLLTTSVRSDADADADTETTKGADAPTSYNDWLKAIRSPKSVGETNGIGVLVQMGQSLYPNFPKDKHVYGRVAGLTKKAGSQSKLAQVFWDNASKPLAAPLDYLTKVVDGAGGRGAPAEPVARKMKTVTAGGGA